MEKKDFKKGQKAILLSLKNVDFRKTMDIDATTEECTVVKVGRKYITVEDSHGWEIRFDIYLTWNIRMERLKKLEKVLSR